MLVLFDIDGTLLLTQGAGIAAMADAGRELYGDHFTVEGVEFAGRLDVLIWRDLAVRNNAAGDQHNHQRFREAYGRCLAARLRTQRCARLLPGVRELITELERSDQLTLGLLTGNYPETGRLKIEAAGLDPDVFQVAAWGCDGHCRRDLPLVALDRHARSGAPPLTPDRVVIVGDTPHDIDCARAHGCRALGVATGAFTAAALREAGADLAVHDLSDTATLLGWIVNGCSLA